MSNHCLPPGQFALDGFPRFGLSAFANRRPRQSTGIELLITGNVGTELHIGEQLSSLERVEQISDFHCVTSWSRPGLCWSGYRFRDVYEQLIVPQAAPASSTAWIGCKSLDGYRTSLPLDYLLADDVLLADRLNNQPLCQAHGAPLRLVAPAHYGYKSAKHVCALHCLESESDWKGSGNAFITHPIARVRLEERSRVGPGWLFRYLYRPFVKPTIRQFERADAQARSESAAPSEESR